ncbi:hypothetical protein [Fibrisoma limi]|nr:hypothetical protein [Fibrisoma limi]
MKSNAFLRLAVLAAFFATASFTAQAQPTTNRKPLTIAREGSWVVEWNPKDRHCTVRFYNDKQQLIYEETMSRRLNIARRQTQRNLNAALEQAMFVWNETHKMPTDRQWVAIQFDKN